MEHLDYLDKADGILSNEEALNYFINIQESRPIDNEEHATKKWNTRAESWKKERANRRKGTDREDIAVEYLTKRGILQPEYDVVDIGCGPGRFVIRFAEYVRKAVGFDISDKMIEQGNEYLQSSGVTNAYLYTGNFHTMNIEKSGYKKAFDLVFSSMTPAIHGIDNLQKSMDMSREWCCNVTHLSGRNVLRERLIQEVFNRKAYNSWTGKQFYSLFNVLFLKGYNPETSYSTQYKDYFIAPDDEYVEYIMKRCLPAAEVTKENETKIREWLLTQVNEDGLIHEISNSTNGTILWNVNDRTERPDYKLF